MRSYDVPSRTGSNISPREAVTEIYVYGPDHRLVWRRTFNEHDALNGVSLDEWYLKDVRGRQVRERKGFSTYQAPFTFEGAALDGVVLAGSGEVTDEVLTGERLLGRTRDLAGTDPERQIFHYDIQGHLFASSTEDGEVSKNASPIQ